jgi:hypothetical protein
MSKRKSQVNVTTYYKNNILLNSVRANILSSGKLSVDVS